MLGAQETTVLTTFCELAVPGSAAIGLVATSLDSLAGIAHTDAFRLLRDLAVEAYYGDEETTGPTGHEVIGFRPPQARWLRTDWSFLDAPTEPIVRSTVAKAEIVVVGSGAGGGLIAAELGRVARHGERREHRYRRAGSGRQCRDHQGFRTRGAAPAGRRAGLRDRRAARRRRKRGGGAD